MWDGCADATAKPREHDLLYGQNPIAFGVDRFERIAGGRASEGNTS
jgi:hypothetical protein